MARRPLYVTMAPTWFGVDIRWASEDLRRVGAAMGRPASPFAP